MPAKSILLSISALVCFAAAYRFGSHGFPVQDSRCIALSGIAVGLGALLTWFAIRGKRPKRE